MEDQVTMEQRVALLENAMARTQKELFELQQAMKKVQAGPAPSPYAPAQPVQNTLIPEAARPWFAGFNERGFPQARIAMLHEIQKQGGSGRGDWTGDPEVKRDPARWKGESMVGRRYSETSPEWLEQHAGFCEWKASKDLQNPEKVKWAGYALRDAALAKGWAQALKSGAVKATAYSHPRDDDDFGSDDGIPF